MVSRQSFVSATRIHYRAESQAMKDVLVPCISICRHYVVLVFLSEKVYFAIDCHDLSCDNSCNGRFFRTAHILGYVQICVHEGAQVFMHM